MKLGSSGLMGGKLGTIWTRAGHDVNEARNKPNRPSLAYDGDDARAKSTAMQLTWGRRPALACEGMAGPEVAYRLAWFKS